MRVLVADDDDAARSLYAILVREVAGISSVVEAADGHDAVLIARGQGCQIAVLDFNMPRLDGVEAAVLLRRDRPSPRVAVHSSDPDGLEERAAGLGRAVFDKLDFEGLLGWVERQAGAWHELGSATVGALARRRYFSCPFVGMASFAASRQSVARMCDGETTWEAAVSEAPESGFRSFG